MLRMALAAMGTRFELLIADGTGDLAAAGEAALAEIAECHARFSRFAADSLVSHLARTPADTPVRLDRDTFELFADAIAVSRASGGAFDITMTRGGTDTLVLDDSRWSVTRRLPDVGLDLGAIAKGHALDLAAAVLRDAGVTAALLHGGTSSVVAIGAPEGEPGWGVALPFAASHQTLRLRDEALGVSNPASQSGDGGAAHIIDPRVGRPVSHARHVAVAGPAARLCDAWSTALAVLEQTPADFPAGYRVYFDH